MVPAIPPDYTAARISPEARAVIPLADFADSYKTQQVLEGTIISASEHRPVKMSEIQ